MKVGELVFKSRPDPIEDCIGLVIGVGLCEYKPPGWTAHYRPLKIYWISSEYGYKGSATKEMWPSRDLHPIEYRYPVQPA